MTPTPSLCIPLKIRVTFGAMGLLLLRVTTTIASIYRVILVRAEIQMVNIPARWVVTVMKHELPFWDRPVLLLPRLSMSKYRAAIPPHCLVPHVANQPPRRDDAFT